MEQLELLRKVPLLSELPLAELNRLAATLRVVALDAGTVLFREGEPGDSLYIIIAGCVDVILALGSADEKVIATLGPGEFMGEMSLLLPGGQRTASIRAAGAARLWLLARADFDALLHRQPTLAYTMIRALSQRLDVTNNATFRDLKEKNRQLQQAYDELKAAQAQIIEKERLEREIQVAAEIQMSILPRELPRIPGFDFGARMLPARLVGGDFYDVLPLDGGRIGILIGDVADKGVPSAIFMARVHALVTAEAVHGGSPGQILRRVHQHLIQLEQSELFVTAIFGILQPESGEFEFARAGHEMPLLVAGDGQACALARGLGQAIGMLDAPRLDENRIVIPPGGMLLLFSDGLTDGRNQKGEPFGRERLEAALAKLAGLDAQEACDRLLRLLRKFQSTALQDDDMTILAAHSSP